MHNQFKVNKVYKYNVFYDTENYTSVLVKIIKKYPEYALVKVVGVFKDKPSNYFKYLMQTNYHIRVGYEYLKEYEEC